MNYIYETAIGKLLLRADDEYLRGLRFLKAGEEVASEHCELTPVLTQAVRWLDEYFAGNDPQTPLPPMILEGTPFQKMVWGLLLRIPYGTTMTYGDLAHIIISEHGVVEMSAQAVGNAVGRNPIAIMVPCHRVVGSRGRLMGYGGGPERKKFLLDLESQHREASI